MTSTGRPAGAALVAGTMLVMLAVLGLGGCGQTGPLYLPDSGTVVTRPSQSAPTPSAPAPSAPAPTPSPPPSVPPQPKG